MRIIVDADATPVAVKDILFRAAERRKVELILFANSPIRHPESPLISMMVVSSGPDEADDRIVEIVQNGDLVITADIPLADRVIDKRGCVISPRGDLLTSNNIKERLAMRDLMDQLRSGGIETGGPPSFSQKDRSAFANQLDAFFTRNKIK
ncbi:MAG TPA: YaiI/YqxD family protein [Spirochaetota bacterium]